MKKKQRVVLIQGAFEIINAGHVRCFRRAKSEGDYLIVALNTNHLLADYKKRLAVMPWRNKAEIIRSVRYVDQVVQAHSFSPLALLKRFDVDVYCIGDEWTPTKAEEIAWIKAKGGKIIIMPRYADIVCTSEIKRRLLNEAKSTIT